MARTARTNVKIKNSGVLLGSSFDTLDFISNISATDAGSGVAAVSATGGAVGSNITYEFLTATQVGADVTLDLTALLHTFSTVVGVSRNGPVLPTRADVWTRVGNTITYFNADASEVFAVLYTY